MRTFISAFLAFLVSVLATAVFALECPPFPQQASKDWEVEVKAAILKIGPVKGGDQAVAQLQRQRFLQL